MVRAVLAIALNLAPRKFTLLLHQDVSLPNF
jgi:hypothetical protein